MGSMIHVFVLSLGVHPFVTRFIQLQDSGFYEVTSRTYFWLHRHILFPDKIPNFAQIGRFLRQFPQNSRNLIHQMYGNCVHLLVMKTNPSMYQNSPKSIPKGRYIIIPYPVNERLPHPPYYMSMAQLINIVKYSYTKKDVTVHNINAPVNWTMQLRHPRLYHLPSWRQPMRPVRCVSEDNTKTLQTLKHKRSLKQFLFSNYSETAVLIVYAFHTGCRGYKISFLTNPFARYWLYKPPYNKWYKFNYHFIR